MQAIWLAYALFGIAFAAREIGKGRIAALAILLIAMMLGVAALSWTEIVYSGFAGMWSRRGAVTHGGENCAYFGAILTLYIAVYSFARFGWPPVAAMRLPKGKALRFAAVFCVLFAIFQASSIKLELLWQNDTYLLLGSPVSLRNPTPLTMAALKFVGIVSIISFVIVALSIRAKDRRTMLIVLPAAIWFALYTIAIHSRLSVVLPGVAAAILFTSRRDRGKAIAFGLLAIGNLIVSLEGRESGLHGLASLGSYFDQIAQFDTTQALTLLTNVFEGVYVQGEVFLYSGLELDPGYVTRALLPLPSSIDNFSAYNQYAFRYHLYVPMSATGEVLLFGPGYMAVYFGVLAACYFLICKRMNRVGGAISLVQVFIFILASHMQFAYPVRNVFRIFILAALLPTLILITRSVVASLSPRTHKRLTRKQQVMSSAR